MSHDLGISPIVAIAKRPAGGMFLHRIGGSSPPHGRATSTKQRVGGWIAYWSRPPRRRSRARRPARLPSSASSCRPSTSGRTFRFWWRACRAPPRGVAAPRGVGGRGRAGACLECMLASQARYVAVMDADLQHDETLLAGMLARLRQGDVDLAVASRYAGAGSGGGPGGRRASYSRWATGLARRLLKVDLTDPMSGFFMLRRAAVEELAPALSSQGFKILLDIVATSRGSLRIAELPYVFRERQHGESKLDARIVLDFLALVLSKLTGDTVSFRFLMFCFVGLTGVFIHMAALTVALDLGGLGFGAAQAAATVLAIAWNFVLNNALTYRDQRLAGWPFITGLLRFQIICAVGALSNVGVASWIYDYDQDWWIAGLGGALMGAVWNYVVSAAFVWRAR